MSRMTKAQQAERDEARAELQKILRPGAIVYTVLRGEPSRSGMRRKISLLAVVGGELRDLSYYAALVLGYRQDLRHGGLIVGGCGMDMGYHLVNSLSYALHGYTSKGADALEAVERGVPFTPRPGHFRAGYSLQHRWI